MFKFVLVSLLVLGAAFFAASCGKGSAVDEHTANSTNAGNANQQDQSAAPLYLQPTLKGDIERTSLAISMAREAAKQNNPQEAVLLLRNAKKEVDSALSRKPRLSDEFAALKEAIDRAINAVESREREAETQLTELQTRIGAIKVNTF